MKGPIVKFREWRRRRQAETRIVDHLLAQELTLRKVPRELEEIVADAATRSGVLAELRAAQVERARVSAAVDMLLWPNRWKGEIACLRCGGAVKISGLVETPGGHDLEGDRIAHFRYWCRNLPKADEAASRSGCFGLSLCPGWVTLISSDSGHRRLRKAARAEVHSTGSHGPKCRELLAVWQASWESSLGKSNYREESTPGARAREEVSS